MADASDSSDTPGTHSTREPSSNNECSDQGDCHDFDLDDLSEDDDDQDVALYGDFTLVPHKSINKASITRVKPRSHSKSPRRVLWSLPPEVLQLICSFSSQATLRQVIRLVSRLWNATAQPFITRAGTWRFDGPEEEAALLDWMRSVHVGSLTVIYNQSLNSKSRYRRTPPYDRLQEAWMHFFDAISDPIPIDGSDIKQQRQQQEQQQQQRAIEACGSAEKRNDCEKRPLRAKRTSLVHHLDTLVLLCNKDFCLRVLKPMLPNLLWLKDLEIHPEGNANIELLPILEHCASLESLVIHGGLWHKLDVIWTLSPASDVTQVHEWTAYRLTHLDVQACRVGDIVLRNLICCCPQLKSFRVLHFHMIFPQVPLYAYPRPTATIQDKLKPLYNLASTACPRLEEFTLIPSLWTPLNSSEDHYNMNNDSTRHVAHLNLHQLYFSHLDTITVPFTMPNPWRPSPELCEYFGRVKVLHIASDPSVSTADATFNPYALDLVLRCASSLIELRARSANVLSVDALVELRTIEALKEATEAKHARSGYEPPQPNARYYWQTAPAPPPVNDKIARQIQRRVQKVIVRERANELLSQSTRWVCRHLRVVCISIPAMTMGVERLKHKGAAHAKSLFQQLSHCCPLIVDLTLWVSSLYIGQWEMENRYVIVPFDSEQPQPIRMRNQAIKDTFIDLYSNKYWQKVNDGMTLQIENVYTRMPNTLLALGGGGSTDNSIDVEGKVMHSDGRLIKLEKFCIHTENIPGELSADTFEFLRTKKSTGTKKLPSHVRPQIFWPRLESFRIENRGCHEVIIANRDDPRDALDNRSLTEKVEDMRPGERLRLQNGCLKSAQAWEQPASDFRPVPIKHYSYRFGYKAQRRKLVPV
ncbi:hypothetical protein BGZ94_008292 [Podila epigama]|nr:hypothetical protein BGZ94_008292 [Podila epigama]